MTNPNRNRNPAVTFRVGSTGPLRQVSEIRDDEHLYELLTLSGVEWYDAAGHWTDHPPFGRGAEKGGDTQ